MRTTSQGLLNSMLTDLRQLMSRREKLLYSKTESSAEVSQIDYEIEIQRKLLIEAVLSVKKRKYQ
ncbi:MAG: hypothetical protein R2850_08465 [Bacteroidia bacterium]